MSNFMQYKGQFGSIEVDVDEGFLHGKLMFIRDVISYRAANPKAIKRAFEAAVDDYLETCAQLGEAPDLPCKGTFNVRVGPTLHQRVALAAIAGGVKLNDWVKQAVELKLVTDGMHP